MSIEPDHDIEIGDQGSTPNTSYATSIATYIKEGVEENGRRYAAYGKGMYGMPIDEAEQERADLQHTKFTILLDDKLFLSPLQNPTRILDLGTGSGVWANDMCDHFPNAQVTGVDIAPVQSHWVHPNCNFELLDIEEDWLFAEKSYDFIHGRELMLSIRDWDGLCKRAFDHLRPGGYFELQGTRPYIESDDKSITDESPLFKISMIFFQMAEAMGTSGEVPRLWKGMLEKAGFINVQQSIFKIPQGPWPKNKRLKVVGSLENNSLLVGLDAYMRRGYTQILKGDGAYLDQLIQGTHKDLKNPKVHTYVTYYNVFGQRPL